MKRQFDAWNASTGIGAAAVQEQLSVQRGILNADFDPGVTLGVGDIVRCRYHGGVRMYAAVVEAVAWADDVPHPIMITNASASAERSAALVRQQVHASPARADVPVNTGSSHANGNKHQGGGSARTAVSSISNGSVSDCESTIRPESYTVRYLKDGVLEWRVPRSWLFVSQKDVSANLVSGAVQVRSGVYT